MGLQKNERNRVKDLSVAAHHHLLLLLLSSAAIPTREVDVPPMDLCRDFVEYLGPDTSLSILLRLDDPSDLVRAGSVSRAWRRFVITNCLSKNLCLKMCPEVSEFVRVLEVNGAQETADVGSSSRMESESLEREHRIYAYLSHCLVSHAGRRDCILEVISASSTDNYPDESIENTLEPTDRVGTRPSYWSSRGEGNPEVPELLTYRLCSKLCVINEIKIQPFEAFFQHGKPIYSAKSVRFRMGYPSLTHEIVKVTRETGNDSGHATAGVIADDDYVWTYVSPVFSMVQENTLQTFKLPRPVICIGGIVQIELLGRVQKQEMDDLYYICVCHVRVIGRPLSPVLDVDILESSGKPVLKFFPAAPRGDLDYEAREHSNNRSSGGGNNHPTPVRGWILSALLGTGLVADDSGSDGDDWYE